MDTYITEIYENWEENYLSADIALRPDLSGMRIFDMPVFGVSDASDPMYRDLKKEEVAGPWHKLPQDWLLDAKPERVISLFFPFSEQIKKAQRKETELTTPEWLHGRIEGHQALVGFTVALKNKIQELGYHAVVPSIEPGFASMMGGKGIPGVEREKDSYSSTWSERHVAHICGLGTFGLSRGLITEKGMCGRFCSIVTDMILPVTERPYTAYDEWCTKCGVCMERCPAHAISLEIGKDQGICGERVTASMVRYAPRYGCAQCQTVVPCESGRP